MNSLTLYQIIMAAYNGITYIFIIHKLYQCRHTHFTISSLQAEVEGLKWVRYTGPNSTTLETPKTDPVLTSYARLLSEG